MPKVFILENVKGLVTLENGRYVKEILKRLKEIQGETSGQAYNIQHTILNTKNHGIPQSRPRWYCVGIRNELIESGGRTFTFPEVEPCPPIKNFLDNTWKGDDDPGSNNAKSNDLLYKVND